MEHVDMFHGKVEGYVRGFYQASIDHRGVPEAPGRVVTLIPEEEFLQLKSVSQIPSTEREVYGACYRIGAAQKERVLARLDHRERGGYTREVVQVTERVSPESTSVFQGLHNTGQRHNKPGTAEEGSGVVTCSSHVQLTNILQSSPTQKSPRVVSAIVYRATKENRNFDFFDDCDTLAVEKASARIAVSVGPSGSNVDYVMELQRYLHQIGHPDSHVDKLVKQLKICLSGGGGCGGGR
eukprot:GHVQ01024743.1.p1 GENE.GHVQ01024743.1~~GHVQ01024743.1.p1  ORF type:complete len:262 (+),score=40.37 GHVQ01024743.1:74-787(+)